MKTSMLHHLITFIFFNRILLSKLITGKLLIFSNGGRQFAYYAHYIHNIDLKIIMCEWLNNLHIMQIILIIIIFKLGH